MPIILEMPTLSPSMATGNLISWLKKEGDHISVGDVLAEIETDKAIMEMESSYSGILEKIIVPAPAHNLLIKTPIAIIRQKNDTEAQIQDCIRKVKNSEDNSLSEKDYAFLQSNQTKASPLAKRIADDYGVNLKNITKGTGPNDRIVKTDILNFLQEQKKQTIIKTPSKMRQTIANHLTQSKREIPHFYITSSVEVDGLLKARKTINQAKICDQDLIIDAFIAKSVALAMREVPKINVAWIDDKIVRFPTIDIAIAVAVNDGLYTPVIFDADRKSIATISAEISELAAKARAGKLSPKEYSGGSIAISNLGMYDVDSFYSIVQLKQGSILSVGTAKKRTCVENDEIVIRTTINLGYAADHRCIDGATGAAFLNSIKKHIQSY